MNYYAYCRVSSETQKQCNSCDRQITIIGEYCRNHNIVISAMFMDEGISGITTDRPGLNRMLSVVSENDVVIVSDVSRLWRDQLAKISIQDSFRNKKIRLISIENPYYSLDDSSDFYSLVTDMCTERERELVRKQLLDGRIARANKGYKPCGAAPYGYKWDGNEIVIDYNNHLVVKEIFRKYIELRSLGKVKAYCDQCGYKTSTGKDFSTTALKNIIENDFYIGIVTFSGEKREGKHPVFLERELFDEANAVLKRKAA